MKLDITIRKEVPSEAYDVLTNHDDEADVTAQMKTHIAYSVG